MPTKDHEEVNHYTVKTSQSLIRLLRFYRVHVCNQMLNSEPVLHLEDFYRSIKGVELKSSRTFEQYLRNKSVKSIIEVKTTVKTLPTGVVHELDEVNEDELELLNAMDNIKSY